MKDKLIDDLKALGLGRGDVVFTHSSLSALGWVEGGPQTVIDAMKESVSREGTLLFPAFTFDVSVKPPYFFSYLIPGAAWGRFQSFLGPCRTRSAASIRPIRFLRGEKRRFRSRRITSSTERPAESIRLYGFCLRWAGKS